MKQRLKNLLKVVFLVAIAVWIVDKIPFNKTVQQQVAAEAYRDGAVVEQTRVSINGKKTRYLFRQSEQFWGKFEIPLCEITTRENVNAGIDWNAEDNIQTIRYSMPGTSLDTEVLYFLLVSDDLSEFALMFRDGTILATAEEVYQLYSKHFSTDGTGGMSVQDVEGIPPL